VQPSLRKGMCECGDRAVIEELVPPAGGGNNGRNQRRCNLGLGHSERELGRLSAQARIFEPFTRRMIEQAGVSQGMRVLDVGSGTGDVAFLCASLVGPAGEVIGMDRAPAAVETAQVRERSAGLGNVSFALGDAGDMSFEKPFDAIVGRLVLMHQPDPLAMLRKLSRLLGRGGIIAFQEFDLSGARSFPPLQTFEQCMEWITAAFAKTGTDTRMGARLYSVFVGAGVPAPSMSLDAGIWGGDDNPAASMVTEVIRSLLPCSRNPESPRKHKWRSVRCRGAFKKKSWLLVAWRIAKPGKSCC
jgi:ubiquinone/menaquinone biosynthesis C-methylase UbiE